MSFLEHIRSEKRREVAIMRAAVPIDSVQERARAAAPPRDFHTAVSRRGAVIAELKARTPTVASFAHSRSLLAVAEAYAADGASAISIVTDAERFGTSIMTWRAHASGVVAGHRQGLRDRSVSGRPRARRRR